MYFNQKLRYAVLVLVACALPTGMSAASIITQAYSGTFPATITGTLPNQGTALEETITLPTAASITVFTTSYVAGGFEPNLTLFNSGGNYVTGSVPPGTSPNAQADPASGMALDAYLTAGNLTSGQYTIALTDWQLNQSITATNLSDGFTSNYGDGINFVDQGQNVRTGNYSLTVQLSQIPEPSTLWLMAPAFAAFGLFARKRMLSAK